MIEQLMRLFLVPQIKLLCEKIDSCELDDTSYRASFVHQVEELCPHMRFWERYCVRYSLDKNKRSRMLNLVMELVIGRQPNDNH
jgi:hypothetical protein